MKLRDRFARAIKLEKDHRIGFVLLYLAHFILLLVLMLYIRRHL